MRDDPPSLWRDQSFPRLWSADALFDLARQSSIVVIPLIGALTLDATPFQMGVLGAAASAPSLLISLVAGVWVDRVPRRAMMTVAVFARFALMGSIPLLWAADLLSMWLLIGIAFLSGAMTLLFDLARDAWLPTLVGRSRLLEANGHMQASRSVAQMAGPTLGGGVAGLLLPPIAMVIDVVSSLVTTLITWRIRGPDPVVSTTGRTIPAWRQAIDGMGFALGNRILRATTGATGIAYLFGNVFLSVYVLYMANYLRLSSFEIGLVFALGGLGGLIGSLLAARLARRFGVGITIIAGWLLFGLGGLPIPLAILVPAYALILVVFSEFFQWMVLTVAEVNQLSLRQAITPDRYQGRVAATYRFTVNGMIPIGSLLGGVLGTVIGVPATLLVGVFGMLLAFVWTLLSPMRYLREAPTRPVEVAAMPGD